MFDFRLFGICWASLWQWGTSWIGARRPASGLRRLRNSPGCGILSTGSPSFIMLFQGAQELLFLGSWLSFLLTSDFWEGAWSCIPTLATCCSSWRTSASSPALTMRRFWPTSAEWRWRTCKRYSQIFSQKKNRRSASHHWDAYTSPIPTAPQHKLL